MHDIANVEATRQKSKATEAKFDNFQTYKGNSYSQRNIETIPEANTNKYIPPPRRDDRKNLENQRMREGKYRRCGDRWNPKHRCRPEDSSKKLYTCEVEDNNE